MSLFLDKSLSNGRIHRPGRPFTWTFEGEFHNVRPSERESALGTFVAGVQDERLALSHRPLAEPGTWRKEVLRCVTDHDRTRGWRLEECDFVEGRNFVRAKQLVGDVTKKENHTACP